MEYVQERIATLHAFGEPRPRLPADVVVVVPVMAGTVTDTMRDTFERLETVNPDRVVVPIRGDRTAVRTVVRWLTGLDLLLEPIWCNAPAVRSALDAAGIDQPAGKGLDVWLALGVAAERGEFIVVHDADNRSYTTAHVSRLAWPLENGFDLVKGYYARVEAEQLYGRLTRLLCLPLIETARRVTGDELMEYLGSFRYPLAGEYAMTADVATRLRFPSTWGLELGMLVEGYSRIGFDETAQTDLGWHRHDHRPVDGAGGLVEMAGAVIDALVYGSRDAGSSIDRRRLQERYPAVADEYIDRFAADAAFNGLDYNRAAEAAQVDRYAELVGPPGTDLRLPPFAEADVDPAAVAAAGISECGQLR